MPLSRTFPGVAHFAVCKHSRSTVTKQGSLSCEEPHPGCPSRGIGGLFWALFTGVSPSQPSRGFSGVWQRLITNTKASFSSEASRPEYAQQPAEGGLRGISKLPPKARPSFAAQCPCTQSSYVPFPREPPEGDPHHHHHRRGEQDPVSTPEKRYCPGQGAAGCTLPPYPGLDDRVLLPLASPESRTLVSEIFRVRVGW